MQASVARRCAPAYQGRKRGPCSAASIMSNSRLAGVSSRPACMPAGAACHWPSGRPRCACPMGVTSTPPATTATSTGWPRRRTGCCGTTAARAGAAAQAGRAAASSWRRWIGSAQPSTSTGLTATGRLRGRTAYCPGLPRALADGAVVAHRRPFCSHGVAAPGGSAGRGQHATSDADRQRRWRRASSIWRSLPAASATVLLSIQRTRRAPLTRQRSLCRWQPTDQQSPVCVAQLACWVGLPRQQAPGVGAVPVRLRGPWGHRRCPVLRRDCRARFPAVVSVIATAGASMPEIG